MDLKKLETLVIGNGAGTARTVFDVERLAASAVTRITVGSITLKARQGNMPQPGTGLYYFDSNTKSSVNSLGMPNQGIDFYRQGVLSEMKKIAHGAGKTLWVSVAGFTPDEFRDLAVICADEEVDGIELNLGCPNIHDDGVSHGIFSHNIELCQEIFELIETELAYQGKEVGAKISPASNSSVYRLSKAIDRYTCITEVMATNTLPDQHLLLPDGSEALNFLPPGGSEAKHTGGGGGKWLEEDAVRSMKVARAVFHLSRIKVMSLGGISTGKDAKKRLDANADGIFCATAYLEEGPKIFSDISRDLAELYELA